MLTVTQMLRKKGVVGKFVEFFGDALPNMTIEDQATIANMAPEYGATCGFFPVSAATIGYLTATGRDKARVALVEAYAKAQGLWIDETRRRPGLHRRAGTGHLDRGAVAGRSEASAGSRGHELTTAAPAFETALTESSAARPTPRAPRVSRARTFTVGDGDVVIAAITSCTNTSNPSVLIAAGLVARKAHALGLKAKPWVKTSLAPGSQVVTDYLTDAGPAEGPGRPGLQPGRLWLHHLHRQLGPARSRPSPRRSTTTPWSRPAVLSGNRNFEGRVNPDVQANYLASPPLVVAYAIAGSMRIDITKDPIGQDKKGNDIFLKDVWPTSQEIADIQKQVGYPGHVRQTLQGRVQGRQALAGDQGHRRPDL